ncbi:hypothetical protein FNW52_18105 [Flavobacterium sp. ZT3R18]|uniref:hypothetical protein n=1 Tax=Flavobacterium sp. ZT3R18 TaxID=2594429 RepID=UPI001179AC70|nr:hypothetical protein [Flavobacterium sp. ZT3R18]TRX31906.1 hypothetical protein FNW52_18105 [Flavobacterium sp. ZT3R18]
MKTSYIIIITFLLLNLNSCLAQDVKQKTDTLKQKLNVKNRPQLNGSFEKLNLDDFKNGLVITKEKGNTRYKGIVYDNYSYSKRDSTGYTTLGGALFSKSSTKHTTLGGASLGGFDLSYTRSDFIYTINKSYYKNGFIKAKYIFINNYHLILGKEYRFNQKGKLEKVVDHDLGWDFSFEDVLQYLVNRGCSIKHKECNWDTGIRKESEDHRKYWEVFIDTRKLTGKSTWEVIKLDAKTGEILHQIEHEGEPMVVCGTH